MSVLDCQAIAAGENATDTTLRRARTLTAWLIEQEGPGADLHQLADAALNLWEPSRWQDYGTRAGIGWPTTAVQVCVWSMLRETVA